MTVTTDPPQLEVDVPCRRCKYDLRGLPRDGNCPECGHSVRESIRAWTKAEEKFGPPLVKANPAWVRSLAEGAVLAVVVCAMTVIVALLPASMYAWKSTPRKWTLGLACTAWVLSWAASWKLSTREPDETKHERDARVALRWFTTMYLALPFIGGVMPGFPGFMGVIAILISGAAGVVGTTAWFMRAGDLAERAGAKILRIEARLVAWAGAAMFGCCFLLIPFHLPIDSLSTLLRHPVLPIGPPDPFGGFGRYWRIGRPPIEIMLLITPFATWMTSVAVRLAVHLVRAARRSRRC